MINKNKIKLNPDQLQSLIKLEEHGITVIIEKQTLNFLYVAIEYELNDKKQHKSFMMDYTGKFILSPLTIILLCKYSERNF